VSEFIPSTENEGYLPSSCVGTSALLLLLLLLLQLTLLQLTLLLLHLLPAF
jgi:hypothetical protein